MPNQVTVEMETLYDQLTLCREFGWTLDYVRGLSARDFQNIQAWRTGQMKAARTMKKP